MRIDIEIELQEVSRAYHEGAGEHVVLDGVCMTARRGERIAIRGRSGSGKSTLLNLVGGIDAPDSGDVIVRGTTLTRLSEHDRTLFRRQHIGFVYQAFNLIPTLTAADNLRLVLQLNGLSQVAASVRVREVLAAVGLDDRRDSYPDQLSGGEQQRVAVARALCHRPAVVLADEPTGNLDEISAELVLRLLDELVSEQGGTLLVATHSKHVASFCDRVIEIHDGKLGASADGESGR